MASACCGSARVAGGGLREALRGPATQGDVPGDVAGDQDQADDRRWKIFRDRAGSSSELVDRVQPQREEEDGRHQQPDRVALEAAPDHKQKDDDVAESNGGVPARRDWLRSGEAGVWTDVEWDADHVERSRDRDVYAEDDLHETLHGNDLLRS